MSLRREPGIGSVASGWSRLQSFAGLLAFVTLLFGASDPKTKARLIES